MKVLPAPHPVEEVRASGARATEAVHLRDASSSEFPSSDEARHDSTLDFATLYDAWFEPVCRWLRSLGAPEADREDLAQEVFLVVRRRLSTFDGHNIPGWLYRIAHGQVRQHRRRRWFRRVFSSRPAIDLEELPSPGIGAVAELETKQKQLLLERLLCKMSEKRRVTFVLFEVEGYGGEEIADLLDIPINTVWSRLYHARKEFFGLLAQHKRAQRGDY